MKLEVNLRRADAGRDLHLLVAWTGSAEFARFLVGFEAGKSRAEIQSQICRTLIGTETAFPADLYLIIETLAGRAIGLALLHAINWKNRNLAFEVLIGEAEFRSRHFGKEAFLAAAAFAFNILNMNKVYGYIYDFNTKAVGITESFGAQKEAVLREAVYRDGKPCDIYIYGFLRKEFINLLKNLRNSASAR